MEYKIEVCKKVVNDHYTATYVWRILDESNRVKAQGEATSWQDGLEQGRKKIRRL